ncbi:MAG: hypothetical protein AAFX94_25060 [Myxococcota bacterium]
MKLKFGIWSVSLVMVAACGDDGTALGDASTVERQPVVLHAFDTSPGCFFYTPDSESAVESQTEELILLSTEQNLQFFGEELRPVLDDPAAESWMSVAADITALERGEGQGELQVNPRDRDPYRVAYDVRATVIDAGTSRLIQGRHSLQTGSAVWGCDPESGVSFVETSVSERCWTSLGLPIENAQQCEAARLSAFVNEGF